MKKHYIGFAVTGALLLLPLITFAQLPNTTGSPLPNTTGGAVQIKNPLGNINDFPTLIQKLYSGILPIGIAIGVLFIVWSGFKFVLAQGNPEKIKDARKTFVYTIVGLGIFLAAWGIAQVISQTVNALKTATGV